MMLKRMLGPMVMERARRGWMPTSSVEYNCIWITVNPNCVEKSKTKFRTAGSYVICPTILLVVLANYGSFL